MKETCGKLGLVFSGGGAKGAYQIGVWKALIEYGLDKKVKAISGTSVGALNAAMFAQKDFANAEKIWTGLSASKILTIEPSIIAAHLVNALRGKGILGKMINTGASLYRNGLFSRKGLTLLFEEYLKPGLIKRAEIPVYISTYNVSKSRIETVKLNSMSSDSIKLLLLASSAIPGIFRCEQIGGHKHLDGGIVPFINNNTPFEVLIEKEKCATIINVYMTHKPDLIPQNEYPEVKFINIYPEKKFSGIIPELKFSGKNIRMLISRGYEDAIKKF